LQQCECNARPWRSGWRGLMQVNQSHALVLLRWGGVCLGRREGFGGVRGDVGREGCLGGSDVRRGFDSNRERNPQNG